ncbi:MAG: type II secretion system F family protein [Janthinobacterium lividum]
MSPALLNPALLLELAGISAVLVVAAAWLLLRQAGATDQFAARIAAAQGRWHDAAADEADTPAAQQPLRRAVGGIGASLLRSGLVTAGMRRQMQRTLAAAGFRTPAALPLFLGAKLLLLLALPLIAWAAAAAAGCEWQVRMMLPGIGAVMGLLAPDLVIGRIRKAYLRRLDDGLADGLDLLVICVQAGLSLEPALVRVAAEIRLGQREVAQELETTVREIEVLADTQQALANLATRTGLPTLKRLVSTLVQTMRYGTPLTEALRGLSAEVRQQALTRFETRAARLPVLLTLPMILFILPCVFIIVGGPAFIQVIRTVGH